MPLVPAKRKTKQNADAEQVTFEQAVERLEQIIDRIESGEVGLEDSLVQYERGMKLVGRCRTILDQAEKRFAELTTDEDGNLAIDQDDEDDPQT